MTTTRSVESVAATIEEAIETGLKELQATRESVIVEIIEEPSRGILGLGSRQAIVRLTTVSRPQVVDMSSVFADAAPIEAVAPVEDAGDFDDDDDDEGWSAELEPEPEMVPAEIIPESEYTEDVRVGRESLAEILRLMDMDDREIVVEASRFDEGERATSVLQIQGDDLGSLIGRKGETLSALQYLTRLMVSHSIQQRVDFVIDAGGYKSKRAQTLQKLATRTANRAVERDRVIKLDPMPAHERRIIHMTLRNRRDVVTRSEGEGSHRKVTIIPNSQA